MKNYSQARSLSEANKLFKAAEPKKNMTEYEKAQQSFQDNRERLKAERLAREAGKQL